MNMRGGMALLGLLLAVFVVIALYPVLLGSDNRPPESESVSMKEEPETGASTPSATPGHPVTPMPTTTTFRLVDGKVVYRAPSPMRVNEIQRVTVRVAGQNAPLDLTPGLPGTGTVSIAPAKVGSALTADLSGPDFQITRVGGDDGKRELPDGGFAEWAWDVRPAKSGKLHVDFVLYVAKDAGGVPIHYRTYSHDVEVEVNFSYSLGKFAKDYGALTGLSVPVVAGAAWTFFRWLRKKRSKPEPEPVEE